MKHGRRSKDKCSLDTIHHQFHLLLLEYIIGDGREVRGERPRSGAHKVKRHADAIVDVLKPMHDRRQLLLFER